MKILKKLRKLTPPSLSGEPLWKHERKEKRVSVHLLRFCPCVNPLIKTKVLTRQLSENVLVKINLS